MGGSGSGNYYHWWRDSKKTTVEDCISLDVNRWMRDGTLKAGIRSSGTWSWTYRSGNAFSVNYQVDTFDAEGPFVRLYYSFVWAGTQKQENLDYRLRLTTTRPRFGGVRFWFICPLVLNGRECGRRVGKLYLPPRSRYFGCRHCHDLTYTSCQESGKYDSLYRMMARNSNQSFEEIKRTMKLIEKGWLR